jgi:hypothetical protein
MRDAANNSLRLQLPVLLASVLLVHSLTATTVLSADQTKGAKGQPAVKAATKAGSGKAATPAEARELPQPVRDMIDAITGAARTGRIEEMKTALDWNEMKPELAATPVPDPIAYWKQMSADGQGRQILAVLLGLLETAPTAVPAGKDLENNRIFVWPGFAEKPLKDLTPAEEVDLYRLLPAAEALAMRAAGKYRGWRLAIGADGTWHSFRKVD